MLYLTNISRKATKGDQPDKKIQEIQTQQSKFPRGDLSCAKNGKYTKWYINRDGKQTYLPKRNHNLAKQLAVRKYLSYLLEETRHEKEALDRYIQYHEKKVSQKSQLVIQNPKYKELLSDYFTPLSEELNTWMNEPYERNTKYPEHLVHKTNSDYCVRSKSEALIDMTLRKYKIPFRYECALEVDGFTLYPDFTIRHPRTGEVFYWEHFGMMDDISYARSAFNKLPIYASQGIIPFEKLILTFETKHTPLDAGTIEQAIKNYLH